jgi:hypothetical protein
MLAAKEKTENAGKKGELYAYVHTNGIVCKSMRKRWRVVQLANHMRKHKIRCPPHTMHK